jgi:hypothetical protein
MTAKRWKNFFRIKENKMQNITIAVLKGGFVLTYPSLSDDALGTVREVFVSPRKLNQKIKEIIDALSLVAEKD